MKYFFALGIHPELSAAEIRAVLTVKNISFKTELVAPDVFVIETADELNAEEIQKTLGGTIKIGLIEDSTTKKENLTALITGLCDYSGSEKYYLGISSYNHANVPLEKIGLTVKKTLKESGINCRYVSSRENPLSSVIVKKEHLLENRGVEIVLIAYKNEIFVGKTLAVQDFEFYSHIDFGRPSRDDHSGMLPPKLAQTMINLAEKQTDSTLLDPFCGSGTILQMAAILGFKDIVGSDLSAKAIKDTKANLDWLAHQINLKVEPEVFESDATALINKGHTVDLIVTEPYLGPPLTGRETADKVHSIIIELQNLYHRSFVALEKILAADGVIIIIVPEIHLHKTTYTLDLERILPPHLKLDTEWDYAREGQFVHRRIVRITKQ